MLDGSRSPRRYSYLVIPFYLVASFVLTWPVARNFGSHLLAVSLPFDALLHVFLLGWGCHGLTTNPLEVARSGGGGLRPAEAPRPRQRPAVGQAGTRATPYRG
jgi:hypothetical protein